MEKNPTSVRFPAAERSWLEEQAQRSGLSVSDVVRLSIRHAMASGGLNLAMAPEMDCRELGFPASAR